MQRNNKKVDYVVMEEKIYLSRKNISLPIFEAVKEEETYSSEESHDNPIQLVGKLFKENLFKHILNGSSHQVNSAKAEYITPEQILDSAMTTRSMVKAIKAKHPSENFVIMIGDGQLAKTTPIFTEQDFKTLKNNGVNYLLLEQPYDASSISKIHKLNREPQIVINEFIDEIHSIIKNKFEKDVIRKFIAIGQKTLLEKELLEEENDNHDYIDALKHYKVAATKAGLKVKFINISVDDQFKQHLALALQEGVYQTKAKYLHNESRINLSHFNFLLNKIHEHINYLKHGFAGKFMHNKVVQYLEKANSSCIFIGDFSHSQYIYFDTKNYPEKHSSSLYMRLSKSGQACYSYEVVREALGANYRQNEIIKILGNKTSRTMIFPCKNANDVKHGLGLCVNEYPEDDRPISQFRDGIIYQPRL